MYISKKKKKFPLTDNTISAKSESSFSIRG